MFDITKRNIPEVPEKLIDKISDAVGWRTTSITKRMGIETLIEEIQDSDLGPLEKAALISNAGKIIKEYTNHSKIVEKAIPMLSENAKPEEIEDDWISSFMDKARLISDEEVQMIWAKILAKEAEEPGSNSLRTLDALKSLNKNEASLFQEFAKSAVFYGDNARIINGGEKFKNRFNDVLTLEECGLLSSSEIITKMKLTTEKAVAFYDNDVCSFISSKSGTCIFEHNAYVFTKSGTDLFKAIDIDRDARVFLDDLREIMNKNPNIIVTAYKMNSIKGDLVNYDPSKNLLEEPEITR